MSLELICGMAFGIVILITVVALIVDHEARKDSRLPPPSANVERSPDWRRYELQTPRKYVP